MPRKKMVIHRRMLRSFDEGFVNDPLEAIKNYEANNPQVQINTIHRYAYATSCGWILYGEELETPKKAEALIPTQTIQGKVWVWKVIHRGAT